VEIPQNFILQANETPVFRGQLGVSNEALAVKIIEPIDRKSISGTSSNLTL